MGRGRDLWAVLSPDERRMLHVASLVSTTSVWEVVGEPSFGVFGMLREQARHPSRPVVFTRPFEDIRASLEGHGLVLPGDPVRVTNSAWLTLWGGDVRFGDTPDFESNVRRLARLVHPDDFREDDGERALRQIQLEVVVGREK